MPVRLDECLKTREKRHSSTARSTEKIRVYYLDHPTIKGGESGGDIRSNSSSERCCPRLSELLMHFREEKNWGRVLRISTNRSEEQIIQPLGFGTRWRIPLEPDALGDPGKHSRLGLAQTMLPHPKGVAAKSSSPDKVGSPSNAEMTSSSEGALKYATGVHL